MCLYVDDGKHLQILKGASALAPTADGRGCRVGLQPWDCSNPGFFFDNLLLLRSTAAASHRIDNLPKNE